MQKLYRDRFSRGAPFATVSSEPVLWLYMYLNTLTKQIGHDKNMFKDTLTNAILNRIVVLKSSGNHLDKQNPIYFEQQQQCFRKASF